METKPLTWSDVSDIYTEKFGGLPKCRPMAMVLDKLIEEGIVIEDNDGNFIKKEESNER